MKIEIRGMIETSLLDWDGKIVTTLFVPRCNFRCPYCQNAGLVLRHQKYKKIPLRKIFEHLSKYKKWLDGICLTGGEPCLYGDIDEFLNEIRHLGFRVKLDTNGGFPEVVKKLIQKKLVDFVAMDIKAPIEDSLKLIAHSSKLKDGAAYEKATGVKVDIEKIKKSIKIIMGSGIDYEFRTTVVPALHSAGDILAIAEHIKGAKKYSLQNFSNKEPMDPDFKKIIPYGKEKLEEIRKLVLPLVKECAVKS